MYDKSAISERFYEDVKVEIMIIKMILEIPGYIYRSASE
jgi:hypothetical protein